MPHRRPRHAPQVAVLLTALALSGAASAADGTASARRFDARGVVAQPAPLGAWPAAQAVASAPTRDGRWRSLGPFGGSARVVAASPTVDGVLFAGLDGPGSGHLYRSVDGGATWSLPQAGPGSGIVYDIEFAADGFAYAGTSLGLWTSADDGATWQHATSLLAGLCNVSDITVDPSSPQAVWVTIADSFGQTSLRLLRSPDRGATWANRTPSGASMSANAVAVDAANPQRIALGLGGWLGGGEVWVSDDGGTTWSERSEGLPDAPVNDLAFFDDTLLVAGGIVFGSGDFGLYASRDLGGGWRALHEGWTSRVAEDIEIESAATPRIWVATTTGLMRSDDGGATWDAAASGTAGRSLRSVRVLPGAAGRPVLADSLAAVLLRPEEAPSYAPSAQGIAMVQMTSTDVDPRDPRHLAASFEGLNDGGVLESFDGGATWDTLPVVPTRWSAARFGPDGRLYALSTGPSTIAPEGLYRREEDGRWQALGPDYGPVFEAKMLELRFAPRTPGLLLIVGEDWRDDSAAIWRSIDGGDTLQRVHAGPELTSLSALAFGDDAADLDVVAGCDYCANSASAEVGVLRSVDAGASWTLAIEGLAPTLPHVNNARVCRLGGADPRWLLVAQDASWNARVYTRRDDEGAWAALDWPSTYYSTALACDGESAWFANAYAPLLTRSTGSSLPPQPFEDGLAQSMVRSLTPAPDGAGGPLRLYAATLRGVFVSEPELLFRDGFEAGE